MITTRVKVCGICRAEDAQLAIARGASAISVTVVLGAHDAIRRGGTGRTIDWTVAAEVAARRRTILSGGLHAGNVRDAIGRVHPHMVDVSSGVESAPGLKDADKLEAFFA